MTTAKLWLDAVQRAHGAGRETQPGTYTDDLRPADDYEDGGPIPMGWHYNPPWLKPHVEGWVVSDPTGDYDTRHVFEDRDEAEAMARTANDELDEDDDYDGAHYAVGAVLSDGTVTFEC